MKKALALFLCLVMLLSLFPAAVFAETDEAAIPNEAATQTGIETADESAGDAALGVPEATDKIEPLDESAELARSADGGRTVTASGTCGADGDNLTWTLYSDGEMVISGIGAMADYDMDAPWFDKWVSIKAIVLETGLTRIGNFAFYSCSNLETVTIPNSVTSIGESAFNYCTSLTNVIIPDSVTSIGSSVFSDCSSLTSVTIPDSVTNIGSGAFSWCTRLRMAGPIGGGYNIEFGWTTAIPDSAFSYCRSLASVIIPDGVTRISSSAFSSCSSLTSVAISSSVTSIGDEAFTYCNSLTNVTIPSSVTSIGDAAFSYCSSLTNITIPSSVTNLGAFAFGQCSALESVTIQEGLTSIKPLTFQECLDLTSVTIPESVTSIGDQAFCACSSLTSITIPSSATNIEHRAFAYSGLTEILVADGNASYSSISGCLCSADGKTLICCPPCKDGRFSIPSGVTSIGGGAFMECYGLTSIVIPESVLSIGDGAFFECSSLTSIYIPKSVTSIGEYAFDGCSALKTISIPENVASIGEHTFYCCSSLTSITLSGDLPTMSSSAFSNVTATVYYPANNPTYTAETMLDYGGTLTWVPVASYTITYDPNSGSVEPSSVTVVQGGSFVLPTPTREGYSFLGWAEDASATYGVTGSYTPSGDVTLYAIWQELAPATLTIDDVTAYTGKEVSIPIRLENNPGLIGIEFSVSYDSTVLEWTGVEPGEFGEVGDYDLTVGQPLAWFASDERADVSLDGVFATLTFRVRDSAAAGQTSVTITYNEEDIFNAKLENVAFAVKPGTVTVKTHIPGDITGDGNVNNKDYMALRRYIKYHDNEVVEAALDITGDGKVNNKDYMALRRYIKYHDIEIC